MVSTCLPIFDLVKIRLILCYARRCGISLFKCCLCLRCLTFAYLLTKNWSKFLDGAKLPFNAYWMILSISQLPINNRRMPTDFRRKTRIMPVGNLDRPLYIGSILRMPSRNGEQVLFWHILLWHRVPGSMLWHFVIWINQI